MQQVIIRLYYWAYGPTALRPILHVKLQLDISGSSCSRILSYYLLLFSTCILKISAGGRFLKLLSGATITSIRPYYRSYRALYTLIRRCFGLPIAPTNSLIWP